MGYARINVRETTTDGLEESHIMKFRHLAITTFTTLAALAIAWSASQPREAHAVTGWDWWDAIYAQQNHSSACPENPPTKTQWESALGSADDPHWTELTVYFVAYPCSRNPGTFVEFRDWLNYEIHDLGEYDEGWEGYKFFDLKNLVNELDESPAGFWDDGPWY